MSGPKTKPTTQDPREFLNTIEPEEKKRDSFTLLETFQKVTLEKARMWGAFIVGFGSYYSKSGEWPLAGFSPRKQNLTLYVMEGNEDSQELLGRLGKHKVSGVCLHINRLSDVDLKILTALVKKSFDYAKESYA